MGWEGMWGYGEAQRTGWEWRVRGIYANIPAHQDAPSKKAGGCRDLARLGSEGVGGREAIAGIWYFGTRGYAANHDVNTYTHPPPSASGHPLSLYRTSRSTQQQPQQNQEHNLHDHYLPLPVPTTAQQLPPSTPPPLPPLQ